MVEAFFGRRGRRSSAALVSWSREAAREAAALGVFVLGEVRFGADAEAPVGGVAFLILGCARPRPPSMAAVGGSGCAVFFCDAARFVGFPGLAVAAGVVRFAAALFVVSGLTGEMLLEFPPVRRGVLLAAACCLRGAVYVLGVAGASVAVVLARALVGVAAVFAEAAAGAVPVRRACARGAGPAEAFEGGVLTFVDVRLESVLRGAAGAVARRFAGCCVRGAVACLGAAVNSSRVVAGVVRLRRRIASISAIRSRGGAGVGRTQSSGRSRGRRRWQEQTQRLVEK